MHSRFFALHGSIRSSDFDNQTNSQTLDTVDSPVRVNQNFGKTLESDRSVAPPRPKIDDNGITYANFGFGPKLTVDDESRLLQAGITLTRHLLICLL